MRRESLPLLGFAAVLGVFDALLWSYHPTRLAGLLLALPACVALIAATALAVAGAPGDGPRLVPELSLATALAALGLVVAGAGVVVGLWLLLIGAGLVVTGALGIAREHRAARRLRP